MRQSKILRWKEEEKNPPPGELEKRYAKSHHTTVEKPCTCNPSPRHPSSKDQPAFLQDNTILLLAFLRLASKSHRRRRRHPLVTLPLFALDLLSDRGVDRKLKDFVDAFSLFAAAFDIHGAHSSCDGLALFGCHGCQALDFEEVDAGAVVAQVGFEANEDERGCGAEMEDFGIPLWMVVRFILR